MTIPWQHQMDRAIVREHRLRKDLEPTPPTKAQVLEWLEENGEQIKDEILRMLFRDALPVEKFGTSRTRAREAG